PCPPPCQYRQGALDLAWPALGRGLGRGGGTRHLARGGGLPRRNGELCRSGCQQGVGPRLRSKLLVKMKKATRGCVAFWLVRWGWISSWASPERSDDRPFGSAPHSG